MSESEKIKVEICVGTTCFILGASELQDLEKFLPDEWQDKVEIFGSPCLGLCKNRCDTQAPFVKVNETVVCKATIEKIVDTLRTLLEGNKDE